MRHSRRRAAPRVAGSHAYLTEGFLGVEIVDVSTPSSPTSVASMPTADQAVGVQVAGGYAFVAEGHWAARPETIDVSNPAAPVFAGGYLVNDQYGALDICVQVPLAYVLLGEDEGWHYLDIVDVANPSSPSLLGECTLPVEYGPNGWAGLVVVGSSAFAATEEGMVIVDVSNPSSPSVSATFDGMFSDVEVADNIAYLLDQGWSRVDVVNVLDPAAPYLVGQGPYLPGYAQRLFVDGDFVYATWGPEELQSFDLDHRHIFSDGFESGDTGAWSLTGTDPGDPARPRPDP
jgi:hypothetical protein